MDATNWTVSGAKAYTSSVASQLGGPGSIWNIPGGVAIWNKPSVANFLNSGLPCCLARVMIKDEVIPHKCPTPHNDFVYIYIPVILTPSSLANVGKISESVGYDKMRNMLSVRCGSLEQCVIIAKMVIDRLLMHATAEELVKTYVSNLARAADAAFVSKTYTALYQGLLKHYISADKANFSITQGYWNSLCGPERQGGLFGLFSSKPTRSIAPDRSSTQALISVMQSSLAQKNKEGFAENEFAVPWYASNNPATVRFGWDREQLPYKIYSDFGSVGPSHTIHNISLSGGSFGTPLPPDPALKQSNQSKQLGKVGRGNVEWMVESSIPEDPWYSSNDPLTFGQGAFDSQTYLPSERDALLAQSEYTMTGLREQMASTPSTPSTASRKKIEGFCNCSRRCRCNRVRCTCDRNCRCGTHPRRLPSRFLDLPQDIGRSSHQLYGMESMIGGEKSAVSDASAFDDSYKVTDPRFLVGTAELHYNVDSDTQDITREYGTVAQKKHYPRLTDFLNYGITATVDPM
jgi:hypothetical protein